MHILNLKTLSLLILVFQNTAQVLMMRYSRTQSGVMYLASVAVCCDEGIKIVTSVLLLVKAYFEVHESENYSVYGLLEFLGREIYPSPFEFFRMAVPAFCYAVQKNFLFLAVSNLEAAVYQVTYQGKILTAALFAFLILKKQISKLQVFALVMLLAGVAIVQLSSMHSSAGMLIGGERVLVGVSAITVACFTSGFAAIYFEWVLKKAPGKTSAPHSLWARNAQLAIFAFLVGLVGVFVKDGDAVSEKGLFQGFNTLTWAVVALEAFGGLVVALVIKYADTILKNFATAVAIVSSTVISYLFLGFHVSHLFLVGAGMVIGSVWIYTSPRAQADHPIQYSKIEVFEMDEKSNHSE